MSFVLAIEAMLTQANAAEDVHMLAAVDSLLTAGQAMDGIIDDLEARIQGRVDPLRAIRDQCMLDENLPAATRPRERHSL